MKLPRYVAFLRGVSPLNAKMPQLKACFESAGFADVHTVLASGNVVFSARPSTETDLERKAETAMAAALGAAFPTIVRPVALLEGLLAADPFAAFALPAEAKRVITFLRQAAPPGLILPIERDGARILGIREREVLSAYVAGPKGPVFMALIERTFGTEVTTRTWDTVRKCTRV